MQFFLISENIYFLSNSQFFSSITVLLIVSLTEKVRSGIPLELFEFERREVSVEDLQEELFREMLEATRALALSARTDFCLTV